MNANENPELTLLDLLEDAMPIKRQVNIEGWPRPVWVWKLELSQILDLNSKRALIKDGDRGFQEWGVELLAMSLGDEGAPGTFASARGRSWLRRQPEAVAKLIPIAASFNELSEAHRDRKKKSESVTEHEPSSPSPPESESSTLTD